MTDTGEIVASAEVTMDDILKVLRDGIKWPQSADLIERQSASLAAKEVEIAGLRTLIDSARDRLIRAEACSLMVHVTIAREILTTALAAGKEQGDG